MACAPKLEQKQTSERTQRAWPSHFWPPPTCRGRFPPRIRFSQNLSEQVWKLVAAGSALGSFGAPCERRGGPYYNPRGPPRGPKTHFGEHSGHKCVCVCVSEVSSRRPCHPLHISLTAPCRNREKLVGPLRFREVRKFLSVSPGTEAPIDRSVGRAVGWSVKTELIQR